MPVDYSSSINVPIQYCGKNANTRDRYDILEKILIKLLSVQALDMFPWTTNVETVALFSKLNTEHHLDIEIGEDELSEIDFSKDATY